MHSAQRTWSWSWSWSAFLVVLALTPLTALGQAPGRLPVRVPGTPPAMRNVPSSRDPLIRPGVGRNPAESPRATRTSAGSEPRPVVRGRVGRLPPPPSKTKDTTKSDGPVPTSGAEEKKIEDVITFKSNYEKDVRCRKLPLNQRISIDFEDAPLEDVLKFIGCITAQNFITDLKTLKGKTITIMSPKPVTVYEAYKAFLSTLDMNGLTIVPVGKFMKITQSKQAPGDHGPIIMHGRRVRDEDRVVTYLAALDNVQGTDLLDVLAKFKSPNGDLYVYEPTNTLIITDTSSNVRRLLKLIKELDLPTGREHIFVRPVLYAEAGQLVDKINQLFGQQAGATGKKTTARAPKARLKPTRPGQKKASGGSVGSSGNAPPMVSKVMTDERTNSLIIVATRTGYLLVDRFLRKMDVPIPGEGELHIYQLQNADAKEMASTLQSLTQGKSSSRPKRAARGKSTSAATSGGTAALFSGEVKITAHEETNGLLIEASLSDYLTMKKVIEKLDVRRKQVYVEALIMEVTTSKDRKFGPSGSAGTSFEMDGEVVPMLFGLGGLGVGGFDMNQLNKGGLAVGMQGPLVDLSTGSTGTGGVASTLSIPTFGFLLQAIASSSDVNIISTPHILTLENEEAEIQVGKRIPYQSTTFGGFPGMGNLGALASQMGGSSSSAALSALGGMGGLGGYGGGMGTVQFVDADLTLKIKPQVNESNFVRLEIEQSIEDVESIDRTLGPTTSKRKVSNAVVVRDEQPVVIGGLIRNSESEGVDKIPFFGDIPVLGILFRKSATLKEKKNLLMIIVPHIIRDPSDLQRVHAERVAEIRRFNEFLARRKDEIEGRHDYRKKHGALEEIRRVVGERQEQARILEELERRQDLDILGDPESHRLDFDAEEEKDAPNPGDDSKEPSP